MSISPLKKITLICSAEGKEALVDQLQELGCLHLTNIEMPKFLRNSRTTSALRFLLDSLNKRHPYNKHKPIDATKVITQSLENNQRLKELLLQQEFLKKRISKVAKWGDFQLPNSQEIGNKRLWFYRVPLNKLSEVKKTDLCWVVVHRGLRAAYVVVVSDYEPDHKIFPFKRTLTGNKSLSQLEDELEANESEVDQLLIQRAELTRHIPQLIESLNELENIEANTAVKKQLSVDQGLISITGWSEEKMLPDLQELADNQQTALIVEGVSESDMPPTLLTNAAPMDSGEDLVNFFQTPGYRSWDPSPVLFFSFAFFFAMIMADAGYSLLLAISVLLFWKKLSFSKPKQRLRNMIATIASISLLYGSLCNSWFGYAIPGVEGIQLIDIQDHQSMITLSVVIGVLHILLALGITVWRHRDYTNVALHYGGWITLTIAGLLMWILPESLFSKVFPMIMAIAGISLILIYPANVGEARPTLKQFALRVMELGNITKLFGDVLSYLRLFALGLASATLAITFNDLATQAYNSNTALGIPLAILIFIIGHSLNFVLTIVSGVVHGLRLNLIEFYHWSLSDEGYPFRAFRKKESTAWNY